MQHCSICHYESPAGAKFCRQCGAPLYAESELSGAGTRNYGRQEGAPAPSTFLPNPAPSVPPSVVDAFGPETARQYKTPSSAGVGTSSLPNVAPMYAQPAPMYMPPIHNTAPIKKKRRLLKWGGGMLLLLMAGGIGAGINQDMNRQRVRLSREDQARLELMRKEDQLNRTLVSAVTEQSDRIQDELRQRLEDVERAKEDARRAAERGLVGLDEKLLDLKEFEYPGATSGQYSRIPGKELTTLRTRDDFETIVQYYQARLGKPYVTLNERNERNSRRALFQSSGTPSTTVLVQETNDRNRDKISIMRSPFRFPKPSGVLAGQPEIANGETTIVTDGKGVLTVDTKGPKPVPPVKPAQAPEVR